MSLAPSPGPALMEKSVSVLGKRERTACFSDTTTSLPE
jgi:hypothetical protein